MTTDTTTEITEGDWKTLATTEITHLTDEEKDYLPRAWDEWIARVRRDAWDACYRQMVTAPARGVIVTEKSNPYAPERRVTP